MSVTATPKTVRYDAIHKLDLDLYIPDNVLLVQSQPLSISMAAAWLQEVANPCTFRSGC